MSQTADSIDFIRLMRSFKIRFNTNRNSVSQVCSGVRNKDTSLNLIIEHVAELEVFYAETFQFFSWQMSVPYSLNKIVVEAC